MNAPSSHSRFSRTLLGLARVALVALAVAAPGLAAVAGLVLAGVLGAGPALALAAAMLAAPAVLTLRLIAGLDALGRVLAELADEAPAASGVPALGVRRAIDGIRLALVRMARDWRRRLGAAEARAAAAEAIIAAAPDPLLLLDSRRRIVRANPAAGLVGPLSPPCDLASALRNPVVLAAADAVLRDEPARSVEFTLTAPVERHWRARFARIERPLLDGAAVVLSLHDVTELKRAEAMRADFVANASHELRTPLATLTGFIETLRGPARDDAAARERFLAIMDGQARRMTRLVEDLLSLSRIELNEHVSPQDRVALTPLLGHLAETLELRAKERGMRIALAVPFDIPEIRGDRDELLQLFQNLLDNAIKYGRSGSDISLAAEVARRPAAVGSADFVAVAVRDRGDGIAREHLPRLTERFYRVDAARSREMGGTGLGLAIVKHIVNRHRGFLEIVSTPGEGSVFTVLLPPFSPVADGLGPVPRHKTATPLS